MENTLKSHIMGEHIIIKDQILNYPKLFMKNGKLNTNFLRKDSKFMSSELVKSIHELYNIEGYSINSKIYCILQDIFVIPTCPDCANLVTFRNFSYGFNNYCSQQCANNSSIVKSKMKATCLEKYGVEHYSHLSECHDKMKATCLEKYGVEYYTQTTEYNEKVKKTSLEKYGVVHYSKTQECHDKMKATCLEKYGVEHFSKTPEYQIKKKATLLDVYGKEHYTQTNEFKDKTRVTNLQMYGVEHYSQSLDYYDKVKKTSLDKYGREFHTQRYISKKTLDKINDGNWLIEQHVVQQKPIVQISQELGDISPSTLGRYFNNHNITIKYYSNQSLPEKLLVNYIQEKYNTKTITSDRNIIFPYEIDIYLPEHKLGIEFNGKYWHRPDVYGGYDDWLSYHQYKIDACEKKDIKLLHLWENHGDHEVLINNAIINNVVSNNLDVIHEEIYQ